jgi:hypothetical protein
MDVDGRQVFTFLFLSLRWLLLLLLFLFAGKHHHTAAKFYKTSEKQLVNIDHSTIDLLRKF